MISLSSAGAEAGLGEPGTSFRYVAEFGDPNAPYLGDSGHLYRPYGLHINADDVLLVTEGWGYRLMGYEMSGANSLWLGTAGVCNFDGPFCFPMDSATDPDGNIWVVNAAPGRLWEFTSAGDLIQEFRPEGDLELSNPKGLAIDSQERMFISNTDKNRIDVYDISTGIPSFSTTITNTGVVADTFSTPHRLVTDDMGNLFITDSGNNRVLVCELHAGAWTCITIEDDLTFPQGIGIDLNAEGDPIYIADTGGTRVVKCTESLGCHDFATGFDTSVHDTAVDSSGNVYVALGDASVVRKFAPDGTDLGVLVGEAWVPYLTDIYHYNHPNAAADLQGNFYAIEYHGHRITKLDAMGTAQWSFGVPGVQGLDDTHLYYPGSAEVDNQGNVYVGEAYGAHILSASGIFSATITGASPCFSTPDDPGPGPALDVAVDGDGHIFLADPRHQRVQVCDQTLGYVATLGEVDVAGDDDDHFNNPGSVAIDTQGNLYVADAGNCRVQKFDTNLEYVHTFGITGECSPGFETFDWPNAVAVDPQGRIYVVSNPERISVLDANGKYLTTIGGIYGDTTGQFMGLFSLGVDGQGNVYAADFEMNRVKKFSLGVPDWSQANINGFGVMYTDGVNALETFANQLYAGATNVATGATVWRSSEGTSWEAVSEPGFGSPYTTTNTVIMDLIEFDSQLYASVGNWWDDGVGSQVWRSPDGTTWDQVVDNGFGNANNWGILSFEVYNGSLYVGTFNPTDGLEIWRSASGNSGDWEQVVSGGLGDDPTFRSCTDFVVFNDLLYAAAEAVPGTGAEVWRSEDGVEWSRVVDNGFGDLGNYQTGSFAIFNGDLYMTTRNDNTGAQVFRSSDGEQWNNVVSNGFGDVNNSKIEAIYAFAGQLFAGTMNYITGMEVWRSGDGLIWEQANPDGFGDSNNGQTLLTAATTDFQGHLFMGTNNGANGGELWRYETVTTLAAIAITSTPNPSKIGQPVTFTATVTTTANLTPTGVVTFSEDSTTLGTGELDETGVATFTTAILEAGEHTITAEYGGDAVFYSSTSDPLIQIVQYWIVYLPVLPH